MPRRIPGTQRLRWHRWAALAGCASVALRQAFAVVPRAARSPEIAGEIGEPIFSEEAWSDEMPSELSVQDLQVGQELTGVVVRVMEDLGCFVDVGADKQGLVHTSRVSARFVPNLQDVVRPGQTVKVWVKAVSPQGRLDLTMVDESMPEESLLPFREVPKDEWLEGQVAGLHNGGAFVTVSPPGGGEPVEGHVPVSHIQDGFLEHPADVLEPGQTVMVRVMDADTRLTLSMRKVMARLRAEEQDVSSLVDVSPSKWFTARVDHAAPFGVFVEMDLPENSGKVVGLVHISEMREGRVGDPSAEVEEGQELKVRVLSVDQNTGRRSKGGSRYQ
ncbi:unnamed protein product [Effrenium voratum]|nr:unnamed protein product [Effrenium voratum]